MRALVCGLSAPQAAVRVSGLELGGLFGSLIAGRWSDSLIAKGGGKKGNVGQRVKVGVVYVIIVSLHAVACLIAWLQWLRHANASSSLGRC